MAQVRLIHWNASEASKYIELLESLGHKVFYEEQWRRALLREWRTSPPELFLIDLARLPSHGREIGVELRRSPATRQVPLVFCEGLAEKVKLVQEQLPDAHYCRLSNLRSTLKKALERPAQTVVVPKQMRERFAGRTAAQKLGITEGAKVALVNPPANAEAVLGNLPNSVAMIEQPRQAQVILFFIEDAGLVAPELSRLRSCAPTAKLWTVWRKKSSKFHNGVTEQLVRDQAIALGLVDYKVCSVNEDWTAMLFAARKA